jgi:hypothetical protein
MKNLDTKFLRHEIFKAEIYAGTLAVRQCKPVYLRKDGSLKKIRTFSSERSCCRDSLLWLVIMV